MFICFFFFQAEDGIRDYKVTGVQTCALPILLSSYYLSKWTHKPVQWGYPISISFEPTTSCNLRCPECPSGLREIGRASCRERVKIWVVTVVQKKKQEKERENENRNMRNEENR